MAFPIEQDSMNGLMFVSHSDARDALRRAHEFSYEIGFEDCKRKVLAILAGHEENMYLEVDMRNLVFGDISRLKAIE